MSMEFNKLAAAVLMAGIVAMLCGFLARQLFHVEHPEEMAYAIAGVGGPAEQPEAPAEEALDPVLPLLAEADPANGEALFRACVACHTVEEGGANKVGPNLWGVVGRPIASHEGFAYSDGLSQHAGETWTYENLNHFIHAPREFAPGTKMTYGGMRKVEDRADVIAFLRQHAAEPVPLPTQEEIDAVMQEAAAEPAEGAAEGEAAAAEGGDGGSATAEGAASEGAATEGSTAEGTAEGQAATEGEGAGDTQQAAADGGGDPLLTAIAAADPAEGEKKARVCVACHTFDQGGPNKVGPNLYGVIGQAFAHLEGYNYSQAFQEAHEAGRTWSYADLDAYLANPREFLPGNKMTFAGLKKAEDRAAVIAYLRQQHDNPPPLD